MLDGWKLGAFAHEGVTRPVYRRGAGPGVVIMHEIPGITPQVETFGRRVADAGFTAVMPELFGTPGKAISPGYVVGQMLRACVSREFRVLAAHESSPITDWLRALCRRAHEELGGKGVGAIGMCLTGNFALSLMMEPCLMAPVLSQPSLPFPLGRERRRGLHVSPEELAHLKKRVAEGAKVIGLRFDGDPMCPGERFARLREELGPEGFEGIEIPSARANPDAPKPAHSVLTTHLIDREGEPTRQALDRVLGFFAERLRDDAGH